MRVAHVQIGQFITGLKDEQNHVENQLAQLEAGQLNVRRPKAARYARYDLRLKNVVLGYDKNSIMQYLRCIAHNVVL